MAYSELHTKAYLLYTHTYHTHQTHSFLESTSQLCTLELQEEFLSPNQDTTCECSYSCVCVCVTDKTGKWEQEHQTVFLNTLLPSHKHVHTVHTTHTPPSQLMIEGLHDLGVGSLVELQFLVVEGLGICSAILGTPSQESGVQCQVILGEGLQSVDMLYSNDTNIGPLFIVKAHQSQHNKSTPNKSTLSKSPAYRGHLGVFHKLCKVEECRCDLRDVGTERASFRLPTKPSF